MPHLISEDSDRTSASIIEERFFPIFQYAAVGFAKVGLNCQWLRVNEKLCHMTGYSEAELLNMTFCDVTHPDDLEMDLSNMKAVISGGMPINVMEKRYIRKDGTITWVHLTAALVKDELDQPEYFITIIEDITERKAAEKALLQSNRDLERFATIISHHLQKPLRKAMAFSNFIQKDADALLSNESKDYLSRMQTSIRQMQFLITDLLNFSKVIKKNKPFKKVYLQKVILAATEELIEYRREMNGRIEIVSIPDVPIWGNEEQLQQVFQNLIENALKFHQANRSPIVKITATADEQTCEIHIEDNGIGFKAEYADRIFEMFQCPTQNKYPGAGIGLSLVRKIIEQHNGCIVAYSKPEQGSVFIVKLPTKLAKTNEIESLQTLECDMT